MLVQENHGVRKVICYASRSLTDVERRYSTTEKEALAAVWACEKFHMYLYAVNFELIVDHKALEFIFSPKCRPSARVQRWAIRLMPYNFKIRAIPGKENAADALSRLLPKPSMDEEKQNTNKTEEYIKLIVHETTPNALSAQEVEEASKDDPGLQQVRQQLSNNKWDKSSKTFFPMRDELCSIGYLVLRGTRIVIPKALRSRFIKLAHTGHLGIVGTKQRLRSKVW